MKSHCELSIGIKTNCLEWLWTTLWPQQHALCGSWTSWPSVGTAVT